MSFARFDTRSDKILVYINFVCITFLIVLMFYPFWEQFIMSISSREEALKSGLHLVTLKPNISAYIKICGTPEIATGFFNSVIRVVLGTGISIVLTSMAAYPLSKPDLPFNRFFTGAILFTFMFSGGIIPAYLLVKSLGMIDTVWALVLPPAVNAWNLIIMRNFLKSIPDSLEESAKMDGANDILVWLRIILPLSRPVLATVSLWIAVFHWNAYFDALIYISSQSKVVIQIILRRILLEDQLDFVDNSQFTAFQSGIKPTGEMVKAAIIMVATVPIVIVYPFLQKHFVKGIMLGSVKE